MHPGGPVLIAGKPLKVVATEVERWQLASSTQFLLGLVVLLTQPKFAKFLPWNALKLIL